MQRSCSAHAKVSRDENLEGFIMNLRSVFLFVIFIFCGIFLVVNWQGIVTDVPVNLLFEEVQAPLGLILLLVLGFLVVLCLLYAFLQQASLALEMRRAHKELEEARQLAQRAERSRFVELNNELQKVVKDLQEQSVTRHNAVLARLETLEERMRVNMHDTINSVSASVGEVEDRLSQLVRVQTNALKEQKQSADDKQ